MAEKSTASKKRKGRDFIPGWHKPIAKPKPHKRTIQAVADKIAEAKAKWDRLEAERRQIRREIKASGMRPEATEVRLRQIADEQTGLLKILGI
jgi:hypothetical protein